MGDLQIEKKRTRVAQVITRCTFVWLVLQVVREVPRACCSRTRWDRTCTVIAESVSGSSPLVLGLRSRRLDVVSSEASMNFFGA